MRNAIDPPTSAPIAVNSSRLMPEPEVGDVPLEVDARRPRCWS